LRDHVTDAFNCETDAHASAAAAAAAAAVAAAAAARTERGSAVTSAMT